jgi:hypothetical protein
MSLQRATSFGLACFASTALCRQISQLDRGRAEDMLHSISNEVRRHDDDPKPHRIDRDAKLAEAKQQI